MLHDINNNSVLRTQSLNAIKISPTDTTSLLSKVEKALIPAKSLGNFKSLSFLVLRAPSLSQFNNISEKISTSNFSGNDEFDEYADTIVDDVNLDDEVKPSLPISPIVSPHVKLFDNNKTVHKTTTFWSHPTTEKRIDSPRSYLEAVPGNCGIAKPHLEAIKNLCKEIGIFLLGRITEDAARQLIELFLEKEIEEVAAKNMDLKGKSANGGIAKGLIPVDPAFSKQGLSHNLVPQTNFFTTDNYKKAKPIQLYLETVILDARAKDNLIEYFFDSKEKSFFSQDNKNVSGLSNSTRYFISKEDDNCPKNILYIATKTENQDRWNVSFVKISANAPTEFDLLKPKTPLYIFAYDVDNILKRIVPDYDMWGFIPDYSLNTLNSSYQKVQDPHGESIISVLGQKVLKRINEVCGLDVGLHGAEAQNIGFAQPLDEDLVVFTPTGLALIVNKEDLAKTLTDIFNHAGLITWNSVYEDDTLPLGGKLFGVFSKDDKDTDTVTQLKNLFKDFRGEYKQKFNDSLNPAAITNVQTEHSINIKREEILKYLKPKQLEPLENIIRFHSELESLLSFSANSTASEATALRFLSPMHFKNNVVESQDVRQMLFTSVQQAVDNTDKPDFKPQSIKNFDSKNLELNASKVKFNDDQTIKHVEQRIDNAIHDMENWPHLTRSEATIKYDLDFYVFNNYLNSINHPEAEKIDKPKK